MVDLTKVPAAAAADVNKVSAFIAKYPLTSAAAAYVVGGVSGHFVLSMVLKLGGLIFKAV